MKQITDTLFKFISSDGYNLTHKFQSLSNRGYFGSIYTSVYGLQNKYTVDYLSKTSDGRILFGGRGAPYHFGSSIKDEYDRQAADANASLPPSPCVPARPAAASISAPPAHSNGRPVKRLVVPLSLEK